MYTQPATHSLRLTGNDEAIVQIQYTGPAGIDYVNPADDPRKPPAINAASPVASCFSYSMKPAMTPLRRQAGPSYNTAPARPVFAIERLVPSFRSARSYERVLPLCPFRCSSILAWRASGLLTRTLEPGLSSQLTRCWREPDSNHRSRGGVRRRHAVGSRSRRLFRERVIKQRRYVPALETSVVSRGTDGSNPVPSGEKKQARQSGDLLGLHSG